MGNTICCCNHQERGLILNKKVSEEGGAGGPNMKDFKNLKSIIDIKELYDFGDILGSGSYGTVRRATRKIDKFECAVK